MEKEILIFKLVTNEDVLAILENETTNPDLYHLVNPVMVSIMRGNDGMPQLGFAPFPLHGSREQPSSKMQKTFLLEKRQVVYSYVPDKEIIENYNNMFSGLILPKSQQILMG